jgi:hypothetical protein
MSEKAASQLCYICLMKTASLPAVRIAPELRDRAQSQLRDGESLSAFVEEAVRLNVLRREADREFVERGLASLARAQQSGKYHSAGKVLRELRADLAAVRKRAAAETG